MLVGTGPVRALDGKEVFGPTPARTIRAPSKQVDPVNRRDGAPAVAHDAYRTNLTIDRDRLRVIVSANAASNCASGMRRGPVLYSLQPALGVTARWI
jgi:hypothetical protein